jgi:hypothetical protein
MAINRVFCLSLLVILGLAAVGLWMTQSAGETAAGSVYLVTVGLMLAALMTAGVFLSVARRQRRARPMSDEKPPVGPGTWAKEDEEHRANKQEGDPDALAVEGDPRGGTGSDAYRHADPRTIVIEGDVAMSGPGGAPQDGLSADERPNRGT